MENHYGYRQYDRNKLQINNCASRNELEAKIEEVKGAKARGNTTVKLK